MSLKAKVEAILFLNERPQSATEIAAQANTDLDAVRQVLTQLLQEYESREDSGISINTENGYSMVVKEEFEELTQQILPLELRTGCLRTLSTIALKEPIYQKDLIEIRGGGAYDHIKELLNMGLIKKRKEGSNNILLTTKIFSDYFKLSENGLELQHILKTNAEKIEFVHLKQINHTEEMAEIHG
jgi:segregation and condensation protein B